MKKPTDDRRRWHKKRQHRQLRRTSRRIAIVSILTTAEENRVVRAGSRSVFPPLMSFDASASETLTALGNIRNSLNATIGRHFKGYRVATKSKHSEGRLTRSGTYRPVESIRSISPAAALVLAAEYQRMHTITGQTPTLINVHRWDANVFRTLEEVGFFNIVGVPFGKPSLRQDRNLELIPMRSGETADPVAVNEIVRDLKSLYPKTEADTETDAGMLQLYSAMVEAVVNVVRHAYPTDQTILYRPIHRWWMTGAVDKLSRSMTAVVLDQGVSIPRSLPTWEKYAGVKRRLLAHLQLVSDASDRASDGAAIAAAFEEGASSTGDDHRGHGLAQMRDFVNGCKEGHLRVLSRCGEVVFSPGGKRSVRTHPSPLNGTLIEWSVKL